MVSELLSKYFLCPACRNPGLELHEFRSDQGRAVDGAALCRACSAWYRFEGGLLELLVESLQDAGRKARFTEAYGREIARLPAQGARALAADGDEHKLGQKSFYDVDALPYETQMMKLPFWNAVDEVSLKRIRAAAGGDGGVLLEVGCGTGRISIPAAGEFRRVLGFDISEAMVRTALRKRDEMGEAFRDSIFYFVGDAENIPIQDGKVDAAVFYGILHHVERPAQVIREAVRALKPRGYFFGLENNRSVLRPVFDALMAVRKLWSEKAHEEHFIMSRGEIEQWLREAGVSGHAWTSVFLPPHLLNFFSVGGARSLLVATDRVLSALPWLRSQGGLVLFEGRKG